MDSTFNPIMFLEATATEALTTRNLLPTDDYIAVIQDFNEKSFIQKPSTKMESGIWTGVSVRLRIDLRQYPQIRDQVGVDEVLLFHMVTLELNEGGALDYSKDKNRGLRAYREALGQNQPGKPWNFRMMQGQPVRVKVDHRQREDGSWTEDIKAVTAV